MISGPAVTQALADVLTLAARDFEAHYPGSVDTLNGIRAVFSEVLNPVVKASGHAAQPLVVP